MKISVTPEGAIAVELSPGETKVLLEELGDMSSKGRPKVRQLHLQLGRTLEALPGMKMSPSEREPRRFF